MEQFVNFVIRPPRAEYCLQDLLEPEFILKGRRYQRKDVEVKNRKGQSLFCSHYMPQPFPEETKLPCVIYCHGNSGCRADANEAAIVLLCSNITLFALDFSGSGLSDGNYVSLGWHEKEDLQVVVEYLRSLNKISCIGLWGRSMGAVTSLLYGAEDPSIAGMVLDSPFSNLFDLMMELADAYKIRLPKFTVKVALQILRRIIQKRAHFDIMDLNPLQAASKSFIPALFGHAIEDLLIQPHHSDAIYKAYMGDKNIIKFEGDHNSPRPQFYFDSVTIFFHNVLRPPDVSVCSIFQDAVYYDSDSLNESLICEVINELQPSMPVQTSSICNSQQLHGYVTDTLEGHGIDSRMRELVQPQSERTKDDTKEDECCSYLSSNCASLENWDRCSHGISETSEEPSQRQKFIETPNILDDEERMIVKAIAASLEEAESKQYVTVQNCKLENKRSKLEACGQLKILLSCLKGMRCRRKGKR